MGVYQQAYNADGSILGGEVRVNSYGIHNQYRPQITALSGGGWVVTWQSDGHQDGSGSGIYQQAYNADGSARGVEVQVNSYATDDQARPQITALADGGWVVTWQSNGQDADGLGVYQRVFHFGDSGTAGDDYLIGSDGSDSLSGGAGNDTIDARGGNDTLNGGTGIDHMVGGLGDDTYVTEGGDIIVEAENQGTDTVRSSVSYTLGLNLENLVLTGSALTGTGNTLNNVINGNGLANTLTGGSGNDTLNGGTGTDRLVGGLGDDTYVTDGGDTVVEAADQGTDTVRSGVSYTLGSNLENLVLTGSALIGTGNTLNNAIIGNTLANTLTGGSGNDTLNGGTGADRLVGGLGDDTYVTDGGDTIVEAAGQGNDTVRSSVSYTLGATLENLILTGSALTATGNALANTITGNGLANTLDGGTGADHLAGGLGNDTYIADGDDIIVEAADQGIDTVRSSVSYTLGLNLENLILTGSALIGIGNNLNNVITGNTGANVILAGGLGNDSYITDGGDTILETAGQGTDTVKSSVSYTLGLNLENLVLTGSALIGTGNTLNNVITGNTLANTLNGGTGADRLVGGLGNDTFVTDGGDTIVETAGQGTDTVRSSVSYTLGLNLENLVLTGSALTGTGNTLNNVITGNTLANTLNGGTGADRLVGGLGDDTYVTDGGDTIVETAGQGTDTVQSSVSYTLGLNLEYLVLTGSALIGTGNTLNNVITGNTLANTLTGGSGNDILNGGTGADRLMGGLGNDTYFTDGGDTIVEAAGQGTDTVRSSVSYTLGATLENLILTGSALTATGNTLANTIIGNGLANTLTGGAGDDVLYGGAGNDVLTGGVGKDVFDFNGSLGSANVDTVTDFSVIDDTIRLENAIFTKLTATGTLASSAFVKNTSGLAADADDRIIYETDTGKLFYDVNGSASGGTVHFATLSKNLALTYADFVVI